MRSGVPLNRRLWNTGAVPVELYEEKQHER